MVFLRRTDAPPNPRKRPAAPLASTKSTKPSAASGGDADVMIAVLADAGCTLRVPHGGPPILPKDPHKLRRHLDRRLAADPQLRSRFLSALSEYIQNPNNLRRVLIPAIQDGGLSKGESLARILLLVAPIQSQVQQILLEKLPEFFDAGNGVGSKSLPLEDDVARLIVNQFRWLDFVVEAEGFTEKLMDVLSISPPHLKKEIIGSLPEIIGDQSHGAVVSALERMLQEDSEVIVPVLDSFCSLNLDEQMQEQAVTIALSCIRTVDTEHMAHLLRFLLLSATPKNAGRIISQIREQLKFIGAIDTSHNKNSKGKGKSLADNTEASILGALKSSLQFKNVLCEAILKELKSIDKARDHKVIDVWFLMLIYMNGGLLQKSALKILKKKVSDGCFSEKFFDKCIHGLREFVQDYFPSFLSVSEYLLASKEQRASEFGMYLYTSLFEEFNDTYSRQEILGSLVTHIGSGINHEVTSALETMILLTSKYSEEMIPITSHISGILDYLEGFHEYNLQKVYEMFCHLALTARSHTDSVGSSVANELLMIIRKQLNNPDMKYRKMGIIGTLKIVATFGDSNATAKLTSSQKSNSDEAMQLLKMAIDSCKPVALPVIFLYDALVELLQSNTLQPAIIEWIGMHACEFESVFLSDLEEGQLAQKYSSDGLEGELWMNLDGDVSPVCLNILPLLSSPQTQCSSSLQILPSQFSLLSAVERLTNQGSLGGIDALLGCPLHLPSSKYFVGAQWNKLTENQRHIACCSIYFAVNWILELLNAFSTQVAFRVNSTAEVPKEDTVAKLLRRLRNLIILEGLLNNCLKFSSISLPEVQYLMEHSRPCPVNRLEPAKGWEKGSVHGSSAKKKHKRKKDTENSDPNGKLRQPTILDMLKRAGVVTQEVSDSSSPGLSNGKKVQCENEASSSGEHEILDISGPPLLLEPQRFKFRPLLVDCLKILMVSESQDSCCSDPAAELPLYLYLLRDFHKKLDYLNPPSKQNPNACAAIRSSGYCRLTKSEFLIKVQSVFPSLRKCLDGAIPLIKDEFETCEDHWKSFSANAGNPGLLPFAVSKSSVARSVFIEVLLCYSKLLRFPDIFLQKNLPILTDLLEAFQPVEKSKISPLLVSGNLDHLYSGVYSFLENLMDTACSISFVLATEVLVSLQSVVNSLCMLTDNSLEGSAKAIHVENLKGTIPLLRSKLGLSAKKLLMHEPGSRDKENWKVKGDLIQKAVQIYIKNDDSAIDQIDDLACTILPQVSSYRTTSTQEDNNSFPTLCHATFPTWYHVLHEENLDNLNKMVKEATLQTRTNMQEENVKKLLTKLHQSVNVVVSLVNMCKVHDKVVIHAMAVKYGGRFIDSFLKVFNFLQAHIEAHYDIIIQTVKELQKATRIIQTLCSEAKGSKRTIVTSKVPATKRSMERFLFHVKALVSSSDNCTFWLGNLKHKDLYGQVISSQIYNNGENDTNQEAGENDTNQEAESPAESNEENEEGNPMDEDHESQGDNEI